MKIKIENDFMSDSVEEGHEIIPIMGDFDEAIKEGDLPETLPILPLRNTVMFPRVIIPITVGRDKSIKLIKDVNAGNKLIGIVSQKDSSIEDPEAKDLNQVGTIAQIVKILDMPDGSTSIIIQGKERIKIKKIISSDPYFTAEVQYLKDVSPKTKDKEFIAIIGSLKDLSLKIIKLSMDIPEEAGFAIKNIDNDSFLINYVSSNSNVGFEKKQKLLEINNLKKRGQLLLTYLVKEVQMLEIKTEVQEKAKIDINKQQKEYYLNQQMKTIQDELGSNPDDQEITDLAEMAKKKKWTKEVAKMFDKELGKLKRLNPIAGEYSVQLNYLQILIDLPWGVFTKDKFDLEYAKKILDKDHFGLDKVKDRIIEHLAVLKLKGDLKSPILCLYGPPGVGKTSLGKSIAKSIGRKYVRMSLGGLHDEAEIRGHRKTYIGALPGRILQNIKKAESSNPVFVLDEIDKVGNDFKGDPSSALLEVLDPEQNNAFHDNFLEVDYDLSNVMFIATANTVSTITPALRDRMEMIDVSGYILEEKIEIAKRHLVKKQFLAHGITSKMLNIPNNVLEKVIENYTRESGVRGLDKNLAKITRKIAKKVAFNEEYNKTITVEDLKEILGAPIFSRELYEGNDLAGVVTGLAWTAVGGEILFIETSISKGKGSLTLTGNLGDVMKESAIIALEYIKSHADLFNLDSKIFEKWNIHIHIPEGAIPKDGPSAGITMATSIISALTQRKIKKSIAMTGEITLRGKVLPVGGIKEKILAAKRAKITEIILSEENKKDIEEINDIYIKGLTFKYVKTVLDVFEIALLKEKVDKAIELTVKS